MKKFLLLIAAISAIAFNSSQNKYYKLADLAEAKKLKAVNRTMVIQNDSLGKYVKVSEAKGEGIVWLPTKNFKNGTIQITMRGQDVLQRSFIGLVFHGKSDSIYDAVYCRPFNFFAKDSVRRIHAIQYISHPEFTWKKLRENRNAEFEKEILSPPNPNDWFTLKLIIKDNKVNAFVNNNEKPSLSISKLTKSKSGKIGVFVGDGSGGDFRDITVNEY